jgi:hypothetical protein
MFNWNRPEPAAHFDPPGIRLDQAVEHLEQRGLASAVATDEAKALAAAEFEADVVYRKELARPEGSVEF